MVGKLILFLSLYDLQLAPHDTPLGLAIQVGIGLECVHDCFVFSYHVSQFLDTLLCVPNVQPSFQPIGSPFINRKPNSNDLFPYNAMKNSHKTA